VLDAMPANAAILGFENRWQAAALPHAVERKLPSGRAIRAAPAEYPLAMKLEAFHGRRRGDYLASRDFEDIALLLDRRAELVDEIGMAAEDLRRYVAAEARKLLADPRAQGGLMGAVLPDDLSQDRVPTVLLPALQALADLE
jgi:nucleotidyltransferase AbiEii toxin of type IV toxin-antitoxin system